MAGNIDDAAVIVAEVVDGMSGLNRLLMAAMPSGEEMTAREVFGLVCPFHERLRRAQEIMTAHGH